MLLAAALAVTVLGESAVPPRWPEQLGSISNLLGMSIYGEAKSKLERFARSMANLCQDLPLTVVKCMDFQFLQGNFSRFAQNPIEEFHVQACLTLKDLTCFLHLILSVSLYVFTNPSFSEENAFFDCMNSRDVVVTDSLKFSH